MDDKFNILCENLTSGENVFSSGMHKHGETRELNPRVVTLLDVIKQQDDLKKDIERAPYVLPAPMSNNTTDHIADLYSDTVKVQSHIKTASKNPLITNNKKAKTATLRIDKKFEIIKKMIKSLSTDFDDLIISGE